MGKKNDLDEMKVPVLAALAAGIFAIQAMNIPIGMGTSGHMVGATLVAIVFGSPGPEYWYSHLYC